MILELKFICANPSYVCDAIRTLIDMVGTLALPFHCLIHLPGQLVGLVLLLVGYSLRRFVSGYSGVHMTFNLMKIPGLSAGQ